MKAAFSGKHRQVLVSLTRNSELGTRNPCWIRSITITVIAAGLLVPVHLHAQSMTGGWALQLYGMVQVEPGANVVTLDVKREHIRFVVHNVRSSDQNFASGRFYSETTNRVPGMYMKGPDHWLETLSKEQPGKRVLKITGVYHPESRTFVIHDLSQFHEERKKEF